MAAKRNEGENVDPYVSLLLKGHAVLEASSTPSTTASAADIHTEQRQGSALARGVSILRCFSPVQPELSARELMEKTGIPKPTLFRLLETLCDLGLMRYSDRISKYVIGVGLLNLAVPSLSRMTVRRLARPYMRDFADYIEGVLHMMVYVEGRLSYIEVVQGAGSQIFQPDVGTVASISRTAAGRAALCGLSPTERERYLERAKLKDPARGEWLASRVADAQRDLAEHGFCRGHRDMHHEVEAIAVPLSFARGGERIIFAASVAVFNPLSKQFVENVGPRLVTLARNVESSMSSTE